MKKLFYSQKIAPYVFVLPFVLTVVFFWVFPIGNGILLSFQDVLKDEWVGLGNYKRLLSDKIFLKAVYNSAKYMVGTLILLIPFPMLFATLLNSKLMKKPGLFKSIYFIPALTSVVVAGTIFRLMFGEMETSLANQHCKSSCNRRAHLRDIGKSYRTADRCSGRLCDDRQIPV